jgi:hypothetical protein
MRTKTLLFAAGALAAGIVSSEAQNVYSQNIVGYVNVVIPANQFTLLANPLDDGTNTVTSLGGALPNKTLVETWNGTGFSGSSKAGGVWGSNLSIPPGTGFFVQTPASAGTITDTFVGNVISSTFTTGSSNTVNVPTGFSLLGSPVPFSGTITDAGPNTINLGAALPNKSLVETWNGTGFSGSSKAGGTWSVPLTISAGHGFFVQPASAATWTQTLQ